MATRIVPLANNRAAYLVIDTPPNVLLMDRGTWLIVTLLKSDVRLAEDEYLRRAERYLTRDSATTKFRSVIKSLSQLGVDVESGSW